MNIGAEPKTLAAWCMEEEIAPENTYYITHQNNDFLELSDFFCTVSFLTSIGQ